MATIGGLSNGTSSSVNMYGTSIKGYGGLASGLDTDSLIQGMTSGTRNKITELLRQKTKYQWQSESYRSVSDKLVQMQNNYLDTLNSNSLSRASFFDKSIISMSGGNSDYLSVAGASKSLESLTVLGVGQLAKDTNIITTNNASIQELTTGNIDLGSYETISNLDGESIKFKYGTKEYSVYLTSGKTIKTNINGNEETFTTDFKTLDSTVASLNKILENTSLSGVDGKLGDMIVAEKDGDQLVFKIKSGAETAGNDVKLSGGTDKALAILGFKGAGQENIINDGKITTDGLKGTAITEDGDVDADALALTHKEYAYHILGSKTITFNYNGTLKEITLPDENTLKGWHDDSSVDAGEKIRDHIQKEINKAYGSGKVTVGVNTDASTGKFSLSFKTEDASSIIRITSAGTGLMGENGLLGVSPTTTNRLNTETSLNKSGLAQLGLLSGSDSSQYVDGNGNLNLTINGTKIEGLTKDSSISDIIRAVNRSDAGVTMNYLETSDRFTLTATNHGEAGKIEFGPVDANGQLIENGKDFGSILFGSKDDATHGYAKNQGQDATLIVEYEGGVQGVIKRDTNTFNLEGSTFTLKGTFGVNVNDNNVTSSTPGAVKVGDKYVTYTEADPKGRVTFTTAVDADKIAKAVGSLIEDYNTIIKEVYDKISKKPDRSYQPLSDDEKTGLSESEITKLEDKAKEGLLFNDTLLRGLSDKLRTVFTGSADATTLKNIGLTVSSSYADNGKMYFDEEKFKAALAEDSEKIKDIFTRSSVSDENGRITDKGGIATRLKSITYEYANTLGTKGSLISKAGSAFAPLSESDNALKKLRDEIDDQVDELKVKLQTEINRYTKQFSSLEQLISQMNSQSSWFSQMTG